MSICLNMIVKNESDVIVDTLKNLMSYFKFSYWVISDTGSTDSTKELIRETLKHIPGELVEHEWRDFAYNRTKALECAFNKTDYLFIFDADDKIHGQFNLPKLTADRYNFKFGVGFTYNRPLLITNRKKNFFTGVIHEYLNSNGFTNITIDGNYYVESGRTGSRSKNPNKYAEDAVILKNAYEIEPDKNLASRYAFYCAQSYRDSNQILDAIEWYKKCIELNGWAQEKYFACIEIGKMETNFEQSQYYLSKASMYDSERIEGIIYLVRKLHKLNHHNIVNALYHKFKDYDKNPKNKLFIDLTTYYYELEFANSISAYYANDLESGYQCCKKIIINSMNVPQITQTVNNLQFYTEQIKRDKKMLHVLQEKGIKWNPNP